MLTVISGNGFDPCGNLKSERMNTNLMSVRFETCSRGCFAYRAFLWGCNTPKSTGVCQKICWNEVGTENIIVKWNRSINVARALKVGMLGEWTWRIRATLTTLIGRFHFMITVHFVNLRFFKIHVYLLSDLTVFWHFDILALWHCWHFDILTILHFDILTFWHSDIFGMLAFWHFVIVCMLTF